MKIQIVSDSHGDMTCLRAAIGREMPIDMLIHCGDVQGDLDEALGPGRDYDLKAVRGNCDFRGDYPKIQDFKAGPWRIVVVHGDRYNAWDPELRGLVQLGHEHHADIVCFGHTHIWETVEKDGILLINPGSVSRPRMQADGSHRRSYAVLTLGDNYERNVEIKFLPDYVRGMP